MVEAANNSALKPGNTVFPGFFFSLVGEQAVDDAIWDLHEFFF